MHRNDVGMLEACCSASFGQKSLACGATRIDGRDELDRNLTIEHAIMREKDLAHRANAERADDAIVIELLRRCPSRSQASSRLTVSARIRREAHKFSSSQGTC